MNTSEKLRKKIKEKLEKFLDITIFNNLIKSKSENYKYTISLYWDDINNKKYPYEIAKKFMNSQSMTEYIKDFINITFYKQSDEK